MKIKYRKSWLFVVGAILLLSVLIAMSVVFWNEQDYGWAVLCFILGILILVATYFRFNYGITINEKRVIAIEQSKIKILKYDDVSGITVKFDNEKITAYIKMKNRQEYIFVWDSIYLGRNAVLPSENVIKLDRKFVEKSIESLSQCPKVKIQNFYIEK